MASKHRLRRSCAFCRARKIKCSNETICEACRRQGADCIYDFEPPRPKARSSLDQSRSDSLSMRSGDFSQLIGRSRSSTVGSTKGSSMPPVVDDFSPHEVEDVANALERAFFDNFSPNGVHSQLQCQRRIPDNMVSKFGQMSVKNTSLLSLLSHDLVSLSTNQLGCLGSAHVEDGEAGFFLSGLENDETQTMFDGPPPPTHPVNEYGQRQQMQLIDVWYSSHPLSFLVSKTLLLRELRDGTHDEVLLATMLADANFTIGGEAANARGEALLTWATAQLRNRPLQAQTSSLATDSGTVVYSGVSTRIFTSISTAQSLMLLGWNAMGAGHFRRAINYIELASKMAADLKEQVTTLDGMQLSSRINGIDVYDVEKELIDYLYWTTYSLCLWVFIQTGCGHFAGRAPTVQTQVLIPVNEESSASIQLDLVSENLCTLQKQKSVLKEMWPLAHLSIAIAHACGFHPRQAGKPASPMQRCHETGQFLMESIQSLSAHTNDVAASSYALITYHTLAIQFLFPGQADDSMLVHVVERLCFSGEELLKIFNLASGQPIDPLASTPTPQSALPAAFGLALDTCSRALQTINGKKASASLLTLVPAIQAYTPTLEALAHQLYILSKDDFLHQKSSLRSIRKQLKASMRALSFGSPVMQPTMLSDSSSVPLSPEQGSSTLYDSDNLSTATTPEVDPNDLYVSPHESVSTLSPEPLDTPPQPAPIFNPANLHIPKKQWSRSRAAPAPVMNEDLFAAQTLDPNALGIQSRDDLSLSGMVDLQHAWLPQMPAMMDYDMPMHWDGSHDMKIETGVPTAIWSEMDMVL